MEWAQSFVHSGKMAGIDFNIQVNASDITLKWSGNSEPLADYVTDTLNNIDSLQRAKSSNPDLIIAMENAKEFVKKEVEGATQAKSYRQVLDLLRSLVVEGAFAEREMVSMVAGFDMINDFCGAKDDWLKSGHSTWFIHGNISNEDANMLVNTGNNILGLKQKPFEKLQPSRVAELMEGTNTVY